MIIIRTRNQARAWLINRESRYSFLVSFQRRLKRQWEKRLQVARLILRILLLRWHSFVGIVILIWRILFVVVIIIAIVIIRRILLRYSFRCSWRSLVWWSSCRCRNNNFLLCHRHSINGIIHEGIVNITFVFWWWRWFTVFCSRQWTRRTNKTLLRSLSLRSLA